MEINDIKKISRKDFLAAIGGMVGAAVLMQMVGVKKAASAISKLRTLDGSAYGAFPYGGTKKNG